GLSADACKPSAPGCKSHCPSCLLDLKNSGTIKRGPHLHFITRILV
ncbi:hypothetical protein LEMLEM_LOCUS8304, partial [Lemmus lemmus]